MAAVLLHRSADYQIDSLDVLSNGRVVAGMSRTEGNGTDENEINVCLFIQLTL